MKCIFPAVFVPFPMRLRDHLVKSADAFAETEFVEDEENVVAKSSPQEAVNEISSSRNLHIAAFRVFLIDSKFFTY